MPKAILEFNLPEETVEFKTAQAGSDASCLYYDLDALMNQYYHRDNKSQEFLQHKIEELLEKYENLRELL